MSTTTGSSVVSAAWWHFLSRINSLVVQRLQAVLSCGLTPRQLVLTFCLGAALGIMPLAWGTSLICILFANFFKLNHAALQAVNYLLYPVQLALLVPFFKLGSWLFPWGPSPGSQHLATLFRNPDLHAVKILCWITLKSLAGWLVTVLPAALLAYVIMMALLARRKRLTSEQSLASLTHHSPLTENLNGL